MRELDKVLDTNEKIFWEGKPTFWPFFLGGSIFPVMIVGLFFLILGGFTLILEIQKGNYSFILWPHFWIGFLIVFGIPTYNLLVFRHMYYAITNKRVIIQKGVIGRDFKFVDYDQISNTEVRVGLSDKLFGGNSGSIIIMTSGNLQNLYGISNIQNPYNVTKFFKKISHDIKTDINFPNKYRPKKNPGYRTDYNLKN